MSGEIQINKKLLFGILAFALLLGVVGLYAMSSSKGTTVQSPSTNPGSQGGSASVSGGDGKQDIYIHANADGTYDKNSITVKSGVPVRLHFSADPNAGCGRQLVVYGLNAQAVSRSGEEQVVEFTPNSPGNYQYSCGMRMWGPGKLIVQ